VEIWAGRAVARLVQFNITRGTVVVLVLVMHPKLVQFLNIGKLRPPLPQRHQAFTQHTAPPGIGLDPPHTLGTLLPLELDQGPLLPSSCLG